VRESSVEVAVATQERCQHVEVGHDCTECADDEVASSVTARYDNTADCESD
jgi:hypothetical protein